MFYFVMFGCDLLEARSSEMRDRKGANLEASGVEEELKEQSEEKYNQKTLYEERVFSVKGEKGKKIYIN